MYHLTDRQSFTIAAGVLIKRREPQTVNEPFSSASVYVCPPAVKNLFSPPGCVGSLLLGLLLSSLALIAQASAATITVGNAGDHPNGIAANCNVASTCTLRDAMVKAVHVIGSEAGDTIVFSLPENSTIILSGDELIIDRNLIIDGSTTPTLVINGNNYSRVFEVTANVNAMLKKIVITNGTYGATFSSGGGGILNSGNLTLTNSEVSKNSSIQGGGIFNAGGNLTLMDSTVSNNKSGHAGGGILNEGGRLTLVRSLILRNSALFDNGGGIFNNDGILTMTDSVVSDNTALNNGGGGIYSEESTVTLTGGSILNNTSKYNGAGINNISGNVTLTNTKISGNTINSANGEGGGISNSGVLQLSRSAVFDNTTSGDFGGGIYNLGDMTMTESAVSKNSTSSYGGGISNDGKSIIIGSIISYNSANSYGGGISNGDAKLTLINSTVFGNTAAEGGAGIVNVGVLTLIHDTLSDNVSSEVSDDIYNYNPSNSAIAAASAINTIINNCASMVNGNRAISIIDNGGNLDGGNGCDFTNASSKSNATLDLGALADNGGPTLTMLPGPNSDAIGRGVPSACNDDPVNGVDQRGFIRSPTVCTSGAIDPKATPSINLNQHGLSGSWADPTTSSQGFVMDIGPDFYSAGTGLLFAGWYTYDVTAAGGQRWYTLQAQVGGTKPASVGIYSSTGGRFDSAQATATNEVGRATLSFSDCAHGTLDYTFIDGSGRNGRIPLTRLLSNTTCSSAGDSGVATIPALLSGAWADTGNSGQGLVFDMNIHDNAVFAGWYTYSPNGSSADGETGQRWYTLQATFQCRDCSPPTYLLNEVGIYESTGGAFNTGAATRTTQVGMANLVFNSCTSATLKYTFTGGANEGKTGTLDLARVGAIPSDCHL